ncbi:MAG: exosortase H [Gammaproteobacteria bacterium]|nr:exosortase H [Gammaproteobacteria bacterium]
MRRFLALFLLIGLIAYGVAYLSVVREHVIGPFTMGITHVSGWIISSFGGQVSIRDNILTIPGFSVQILDMCNGVEATIMLWAAILAFPAPWSYRLKGLAIGALSVHTLNILRIISLVYLGEYNREWFDWVHWYLWDTLIMADILIVFLIWIRLSAPVEPDREVLAD